MFWFAGRQIGDTILYTGCRNKAVDYIYQEELEEYQNAGALSHLHLAFSRDQQEKVYVQNLLEKNGEETWKAIDAGGHLYVCGWVWRHMASNVLGDCRQNSQNIENW